MPGHLSRFIYSLQEILSVSFVQPKVVTLSFFLPELISLNVNVISYHERSEGVKLLGENFSLDWNPS